MARPVYSPAQRADAVQIVADYGLPEATKRTGIPKPTLSRWAHKAGVATLHGEQTKRANDARRQEWEQRRTELTHKIGKVAALALEKAEASISESHARNAKDYATTMAILIDKAQLLSGGATGRVYTDADRKAVVTDARDKALRLVS